MGKSNPSASLTNALSRGVRKRSVSCGVNGNCGCCSAGGPSTFVNRIVLGAGKLPVDFCGFGLALVMAAATCIFVDEGLAEAAALAPGGLATMTNSGSALAFSANAAGFAVAGELAAPGLNGCA